MAKLWLSMLALQLNRPGRRKRKNIETVEKLQRFQRDKDPNETTSFIVVTKT